MNEQASLSLSITCFAAETGGPTQAPFEIVVDAKSMLLLPPNELAGHSAISKPN